MPKYLFTSKHTQILHKCVGNEVKISNLKSKVIVECVKTY